MLQPLIDAELIPDVAALQNEELFIKFLYQLPLPLKGKIGRADYENPLGESPQLKFPDEEPRHDRLASPGIVGQEESYPRQFQEIVVNRFELMRERIDTGY